MATTPFTQRLLPPAVADRWLKRPPLLADNSALGLAVHPVSSALIHAWSRSDITAPITAAHIVSSPKVSIARGLTATPAHASLADWARLAQCESHGNVHETGNPKYRGLYQIGYGEWATYGGLTYGVTDPAQATQVQQQAVADRLYAARGWQPWTCARIVGLR